MKIAFKVVSLLSVLVLLVLALPTFAQVVIPDPSVDANSFLTFLINAIQGGEWRIVVGTVGIGLIYLLRTYGTRIPGWLGTFLSSSRGGAVLALVTGVVPTVLIALANGKHIDFKLLLDALLMGFTMIGGWVGVRRIIGVP